MKQSRLAIIVSGHGECDALPVLIRRIPERYDPECAVEIPVTIRVQEDRLRRHDELERHIALAARKLGGKGGILILLDCDWDGGCPKKDGPLLQQRAQSARQDIPISVVLAYKEYESWFLAATESLRGKHGLPEDLEIVEDPERIRGAKEWLRKRMPKNRPYTPTEHQSSLTRLFDIDMARRTPSFDKCYREIVMLLSRTSEG